MRSPRCWSEGCEARKEMAKCIGEKCDERWRSKYGIQVYVGSHALGQWMKLLGSWALVTWGDELWISLYRVPFPKKSKDPLPPPRSKDPKDYVAQSGGRSTENLLPPPQSKDRVAPLYPVQDTTYSKAPVRPPMSKHPLADQELLPPPRPRSK
ncbi:unnamed protein product [Symbiodinium pilosum]|uniref:Uncharacterized protein n=1 Tax=Symbiodinium pilosum TaxID=2952 RepID=A0A812LPR9_SYMPI|nr:unnamed protein product [Symbiodinium pilosum]